MEKKARRLKKLDDGFIYPWTETLSKRTDMVEIDENGNQIQPSNMFNSVKPVGIQQRVVMSSGEIVTLPPIDKDIIDESIKEPVTEPGKSEEKIPLAPTLAVTMDSADGWPRFDNGRSKKIMCKMLSKIFNFSPPINMSKSKMIEKWNEAKAQAIKEGKKYDANDYLDTDTTDAS